MSKIKSRIFGNEYKYVKEVISTEFNSSSGSTMVTKLENAFSKKFGVRYAIAHVNGTATLHSALAAAGVGHGDEVIVPPLTMSSTTFAVLHQNAVPIFADVDEKTFNILPKSIEEKITERTKAIIPVSLYGLPSDIDEIMEIAHKYNLIVVEDNAECLLGKYKGEFVGKKAHMASYSFQSSKHITGGEGGMLITNDLELANNIRRFSSLGYAGLTAQKGKISKDDLQDLEYSRHVCLGWNYRMPELCAAVILGQLENADALVQRRVEVTNLFDSVTQDCDWLIPQYVPEEYESSCWTYTAKLENKNITWHDFRDKFREFGGDGIYAAWKLTYLEPIFLKRHFGNMNNSISTDLYKGFYKRGICPIAEDLQRKILQFKTNYWDFRRAEEQAAILKKTIQYFDNRY